VDDSGVEVILLGPGIGFGSHRGEFVEPRPRSAHRIRFPGVRSFGVVLVRDLEIELADGLMVAEKASGGLDFIRKLFDTTGARAGSGTSASEPTAR